MATTQTETVSTARCALTAKSSPKDLTVKSIARAVAVKSSPTDLTTKAEDEDDSVLTAEMSLPSEAMEAAEVLLAKPDLKRLRAAIPDHCFQPDWRKTMRYLTQDLCLCFGAFYLASWIPTIPNMALRFLAWPLYGLFQGLVFAALWQIGHEMGHGSLLPSTTACNIFGFILHSAVLTPFFAWRSTHHKHHRYNVHMDKDPNNIPDRFDEEDHPGLIHRRQYKHDDSGEWLEDAPFDVLISILVLQLVAWPMHLAFAVSGGKDSNDYRSEESTAWMPNWLKKSHYNPIGSNFRPDEAYLVILSDLGILTTLTILYKFASAYGFGFTFLLWVQPWMWLNNWIIVATFLQHTHPEVPKYDAGSWTYWKSATATIDRDIGFVGRYFFHNVVPYHVVHHFYPRIPFYHAPEATEAIKPILGESYIVDNTPFLKAYWLAYKNCRWVASDDAEKPEDRAMWFVDGNGNFLADRFKGQKCSAAATADTKKKV